jgi:hypothetical protein
MHKDRGYPKILFFMGGLVDFFKAIDWTAALKFHDATSKVNDGLLCRTLTRLALISFGFCLSNSSAPVSIRGKKR